MASLKKWLARRRDPWKGIGYDAYKAFRRDGAQTRLEVYDDLPEAPVVLDFGGYKGEWTDRVLAQRPRATVHMFEPHPIFARALVAKYAGDARVTVHDVALGRAEGVLPLSDAGDGSSAVAAHERKYEARIMPVAAFFAAHDIAHADLTKINIEGGEYELLPALIEAGIAPRLGRIQVQFHLFGAALIPERDAIRTALEATHDCAWVYPFVWEEWRAR